MASHLQRQLMRSGLPPRGPQPPPIGRGRTGSRQGPRPRDYTPQPWQTYFDSQEEVELDPDTAFSVYRAGFDAGRGPVLLLLHGGGFSALTWSLMVRDLVAKVRVRVVALDLRGHGRSRTRQDHDLSSDTMCRDILRVWQRLFRHDQPECILVGHSMGGALAVHTALQGQIQHLVGLCVIDVVEGTAMDALGTMQGFLRSRPDRFASLAQAIEWSVRSGQVRNLESARVSMPGQLKNVETQECGTQDVGRSSSPVNDAMESISMACDDAIPEENESADGFRVPDAVPSAPSPRPGGYTWRIDLAMSEYYWPGWFQGLSSQFLAVPAAKLLLLAGVDRLDRELTVGQMQGKFQMQVLPQAGHAVHEDAPEKVADVLATFLVRNRFAEALEDFQSTFPAC